MLRICTILVFVLSFGVVNAQNLNVGSDFPVNKIENHGNSSNPKIIVFTPSLYKTNNYASMLTTSLYHYFVQGLAFSASKAPKVDVIYIVNEEDKWSKEAQKTFVLNDVSNQNKLDGATVIYDDRGKVFSDIGIKPFKQNSMSNIIPVSFSTSKILVESSILFFVDKNNKILFRDNDYRAQGEHLKPLERLVKKVVKTDEVVVKQTNSSALKVGDKAPDFILRGPSFDKNSSVKLLDDKSKFKVLTFYPAAFSGQILPDFTSVDKHAMMSCAAQIQLIDHNPALEKVKTYAISSSTNPVLELWKRALRTSNITYLNDENYEISQIYNSYNSLGYNNRATYVIDQNGIIVYANPDFTFVDEANFPSILERLIVNNKK